MKKTLNSLTLCMLCTLFSWSCQTKNIEYEQPLSHEQISTNLSQNELADIDPAHLIGEWDCTKFAYTVDGNKILDVATISKGWLKIPFAPTPIEHVGDERWCFDYDGCSSWFICLLSDNLIELTHTGSTYKLCPPEEGEIAFAVQHAYSFIINGNELIIHFTGVKNKNLLILKKR